MKTTKILITLLLAVTCGFTPAQNEKTITAVLKDFGEACGQDPGDAIFCLTDEKGKVITERYTCNMTDGEWKVEPKDLITSEWTLNPKYKGKSVKLICVQGGGGWFVSKVEFTNSSNPSNNQKSDNAILTATGTITMSQEGMGCKITVNDGSANTLTLSPGNLKFETKKYFNGYCKLNPSYEGKKFVLSYAIRQTYNSLEDLKMVNEPPSTFEKDNFKTATCRAYNILGQLIAVVENNIVYPIENGVKVEKDSRPIQNKDEVCMGGSKCVKVKAEADGTINLYALPNITDKTTTLKMVGDKLYRLNKKGEIDEYKEFYIIKGNKTQAGLIAIVTRLGMGH